MRREKLLGRNAEPCTGLCCIINEHKRLPVVLAKRVKNTCPIVDNVAANYGARKNKFSKLSLLHLIDSSMGKLQIIVVLGAVVFHRAQRCAAIHGGGMHFKKCLGIVLTGNKCGLSLAGNSKGIDGKTYVRLLFYKLCAKFIALASRQSIRKKSRFVFYSTIYGLQHFLIVCFVHLTSPIKSNGIASTMVTS